MESIDILAINCPKKNEKRKYAVVDIKYAIEMKNTIYTKINNEVKIYGGRYKNVTFRLSLPPFSSHLLATIYSSV